MSRAEGRVRYQWAAWGDVNAFFGLMLDNIGVMILLGSLLTGIFQVPAEFVISKMIPGTAMAVFIGDLIYTFMAFRLAKKDGLANVTAMPLGLDTPSVFGTSLLILGPGFLAAKAQGMDPMAAAEHVWFLGMTLLVLSGVLKLFFACFSEWILRIVPRAGLLGSLSAIALVLISFLPTMDILSNPIAGLSATIILLACLCAHWNLPKKFPGTLASLLVGCGIYYVVHLMGFGPGLGAEGGNPSWPLKPSFSFPLWDWMEWLGKPSSWTALQIAIPIMIPMTLATIVGGIDCTESAATVGDKYHAGSIIAAEGVSTLLAGLCGGVIQSTPYIGQPAYKAMGGRAAYTLATALFVGGAGVLGYFEWIFYIIPKTAIFPILLFVGLEITAASYKATAKHHYSALAIACVPALAYLALIQVNGVLGELGPRNLSLDQLSPKTQHAVQTLTVLSSGFIITSLLWATALSNLIDRRIKACVVTFGVAAVLSLFGVIHSPLASGKIALPGAVITELKNGKLFDSTANQTPWHWAAGYALAGLTVWLLGRFGTASDLDVQVAEVKEKPLDTEIAD